MIKIKIKVEEGGIGCSMKMRVMEETILKCDRIIIVLINLLQEKNMSSPPRQLKSRPGATNACTCNNHLLLILLMVFLLVMVMVMVPIMSLTAVIVFLVVLMSFSDIV